MSSVRTMTTKQLQDDVKFLQDYPGGMPPAQQDRLNALLGELKNRGAAQDPRAQVNQPPQPQQSGTALDAMTDDQLASALQAASKAIAADRNDEDAQNRFADVNYEMRRRFKAQKAAQQNQEIQVFKNGNGAPQVPADLGLPVIRDQVPAGIIPLQAPPLAALAEMSAAMQKTERARIAASLAGELITQFVNIGSGDPDGPIATINDVDGDLIERACEVALAVSQRVCDAVGL